MRHEIIELRDMQVIGMTKEIAFNHPEMCGQFWGEFSERIVKPVFIEGKRPDAFQKAAVENGVGAFGLCTCDLPGHDCATCAATNFTPDNDKTFTYVIGGTYKGDDIPEGMKVYPLPSGRWLKVYFEGGLKAFPQQFAQFHKEWMAQHPEYKWKRESCSLEWYQGGDIQSPDYPCGILVPLAD